MTEAIFLDIDGTLVSFKTHRIPSSAIEALSRAHEKGVRIFIATGRPWALIDNLHQIQELDLVDGYITMNGACCFDGQGPVSQSPMSKDDVGAVWDYAGRLGVTCIVVRHDDLCLNMESEPFLRIFRRDLGVTAAMPILDREHAILTSDVFQLTPFLSDGQLDGLRPLLGNCEIGRWHPEFVDLTLRGCTKSRGIGDMLARFGLSFHQAMAFGDGGNDIPMLQSAGIGVAMGNASSPEVLRAADYVTDGVDEDGVANALRHFGIID